jgi:AMP nucleosidase
MPESEVSRLRLEKARAARHELISKLRDANTSDGRDSFEAILAEFDALHERTEKDEVIVMDRRRTGQMPAYHLVCREGRGITLVNIGVGPSNAATLVECLMPARPRMVLMIGHCGGLRVDQKLGMYVLAEAYLRLDRVYDHLLHPSIPLQPSSEIQRGLREAIAEVHGRTDGGIKDLLQTGLVATTNFRTNEVHPDRSIPTLLRDSFALAQDMESGTMAAGCRMGRVPSGTLLMISDRPYHAGLKTARRTGEFYRKAVDAHMEIAFSFWKKIRENPESLASRKLRGAIDPPFR